MSRLKTDEELLNNQIKAICDATAYSSDQWAKKAQSLQEELNMAKELLWLLLEVAPDIQGSPLADRVQKFINDGSEAKTYRSGKIDSN